LLAILSVIQNLLVLCPFDVPELLYTLAVCLTSALIAELATIEAGLLKFHYNRILILCRTEYPEKRKREG
jgi:hypothetical protein